MAIVSPSWFVTVARSHTPRRWQSLTASNAARAVHRLIALAPEPMKDVEYLSRRRAVKLQGAQGIRECRAMPQIDTGLLRHDDRHPLGELTRLDEPRVRVVDEVALGLALEDGQRGIELVTVREIAVRSRRRGDVR